MDYITEFGFITGGAFAITLYKWGFGNSLNATLLETDSEASAGTPVPPSVSVPNPLAIAAENGQMDGMIVEGVLKFVSPPRTIWTGTPYFGILLIAIGVIIALLPIGLALYRRCVCKKQASPAASAAYEGLYASASSMSMSIPSCEEMRAFSPVPREEPISSAKAVVTDQSRLSCCANRPFVCIFTGLLFIGVGICVSLSTSAGRYEEMHVYTIVPYWQSVGEGFAPIANAFSWLSWAAACRQFLEQIGWDNVAYYGKWAVSTLFTTVMSMFLVRRAVKKAMDAQVQSVLPAAMPPLALGAPVVALAPAPAPGAQYVPLTPISTPASKGRSIFTPDRGCSPAPAALFGAEGQSASYGDKPLVVKIGSGRYTLAQVYDANAHA